jgi:hypothetical protein
MQIHVIYADETQDFFDSVEEARAGIEEIISGCDFAVGVESVTDEYGNEYSCTWSLSLECDKPEKEPWDILRGYLERELGPLAGQEGTAEVWAAVEAVEKKLSNPGA